MASGDSLQTFERFDYSARVTYVKYEVIGFPEIQSRNNGLE